MKERLLPLSVRRKVKTKARHNIVTGIVLYFIHFSLVLLCGRKFDF